MVLPQSQPSPFRYACNVAFTAERMERFAVVMVKDFVISSPMQRDTTASTLSEQLGCPVILVGERQLRGYGRPDLARALSRRPLDSLQWRKVMLRG
jgi:hypothetical protein